MSVLNALWQKTPFKPRRQFTRENRYAIFMKKPTNSTPQNDQRFRTPHVLDIDPRLVDLSFVMVSAAVLFERI